MQLPTPNLDAIVPFSGSGPALLEIMESVRRHTSIPFRLIIGDDANDASVVDVARAWAAEHRDVSMVLFSNKQPVGPTAMIARGLRESKAEFVAVLSPLVRIVDRHWFGKLIAPIQMDPVASMVFTDTNVPCTTSPPVRIPSNSKKTYPFALVLHRGRSIRSLGINSEDRVNYVPEHARHSFAAGATVWFHPAVKLGSGELSTADQPLERSSALLHSSTEETLVIRR